MKIKYWLTISYLIVMILPVAALIAFYIMISHFDQRQEVIEYIEITNKLTEMQPLLEDQQLYQIQPDERYQAVSRVANETIKISLFRYDGVLLYTTLNDPNSVSYSATTRTQLYEHLNQLEKGFRTYSFKKAVFSEGKVIGIYEVIIGRKQWKEGVQNPSLILGSLFSAFFIVTYVIVLRLLNRKLNRPLQFLRSQMTAFAAGNPVQENTVVTRDEIGEVLMNFYQMKAQIEQSQKELAKQQEEKEFIVASLTHDLKTPLTVIQAYAEALQKKEQLTEQERLEYKTILFEKLAYMKQMLEDLSVYTALQSAKEHMEFIKVDGDEFFDMLLSGYEEPCMRKKIRLRVQQDIQAGYDVSVKHMVRIVDNLMTNGIRHTMEGEQIWLGAVSHEQPLPQWVYPLFYQEVDDWRKDGTVLLIQNEGSYISPERQEAIFQPFVQGEGARGQGGSSGLGLSVAKILIERHGGKIKLWSAKGYGTLVVCWLREEAV
nr:HAMP domain-containing sensor histidine kinase [uncultured Bacillus sp.]